MSGDPFVGEIQAVPYAFAPKGWAMCDGQLLPISQNTALFSLLGTTYGGNGTSNFALPNFQGCSAIFWGQGPGLSLYDEGQTGGEVNVTLLQSEMPIHGHSVNVVDAPGTQNSPGGALLGKARFGKAYDYQYGPVPANGPTMSTGALANAGGSLPHNNMPPYTVVNFIIALQGIFPARS
jgi:microcystin-dependent protein